MDEKSCIFSRLFRKIEWLQPKVTRKGCRHYPTPRQSECVLLKIAKLASKSGKGNIATFENLSSAVKEDEGLDERLKTSITQHLQSLETELKRYFPELKEKEAALV